MLTHKKIYALKKIFNDKKILTHEKFFTHIKFLTTLPPKFIKFIKIIKNSKFLNTHSTPGKGGAKIRGTLLFFKNYTLTPL